MDKGCCFYLVRQVAIVIFVLVISNITKNGEFVNPIVNEPSNPLLYILFILPLLGISFVFVITKFVWQFPLDLILRLFNIDLENERMRNLILELLNIIGWIIVFSGVLPLGGTDMTYDDYMFYNRIP